MARRRFGLRGLFRRGDRAVAMDLLPVEQALTADGLRVAVASTTLTLQILHTGMAAQGWGSVPAVEVPLAADPVQPLPQRRADLDVWR